MFRASTHKSQVPWPTLRGLVEVALYGGRLDNDNDVRVLQTYIANVFTPEVVPTADKPDARPLIRGLAVPHPSAGAPTGAGGARTDEYLALAQTLPPRDNPGAFGLPANIEGSAQRASASALVTTLKKMAALGAMV
jgi:dynein heavy chain 2